MFNLAFWAVEAVLISLMLRNQFVHRERRRVNWIIGELGNDDIAQGFQPFWRFEHFNAISYERMLFSLRRVRSFYRDSPALKSIDELDFDPPSLRRRGRCATGPDPKPPATVRAEQLLDSHLTAEQRATAKKGYLQITGKSGRHYCIHWDSYEPRVFSMRRVGRKRGHNRSICCSVGRYDHPWPTADKVLALKLCLESEDEKRVVKNAVKSRTEWVVHA